jgi:hypothetical protein
VARGDVRSDLVRVQRGVPVNKAAWSTRYTGVVALTKIELMQPTLLARPAVAIERSRVAAVSYTDGAQPVVIKAAP